MERAKDHALRRLAMIDVRYNGASLGAGADAGAGEEEDDGDGAGDDAVNDFGAFDLVGDAPDGAAGAAPAASAAVPPLTSESPALTTESGVGVLAAEAGARAADGTGSGGPAATARALAASEIVVPTAPTKPMSQRDQAMRADLVKLLEMLTNAVGRGASGGLRVSALTAVCGGGGVDRRK